MAEQEHFFEIFPVRPGSELINISEFDKFRSIKNCPCCDSKEIEPLFLIGLKSQVALAICNTCSHVFYSQFLHPDMIDNYYKNDFSKSKIYSEAERKKIKSSSKLFNSLSHLNLNKNSKIIDIGCGNGTELLFLKENGYLNLYGSEMNNARASNARANFPSNIFSGGYSEIPDIKFDVICSNHSLEHIIDLGGYFQKLREISSENTLIMVNVPNTVYESIFYQILYVGHVHSFNAFSLLSLGKRFGFHGLSLKPARKDELRVVLSQNVDTLEQFSSLAATKLDPGFIKDRFLKPFISCQKLKKDFCIFTDDRSGVYSDFPDIKRREQTYFPVNRRFNYIVVYFNKLYSLALKLESKTLRQLLTLILWRASNKKIKHFGYYLVKSKSKATEIKFPIRLNSLIPGIMLTK